jgi:hypothetical protein
MTSCTVLLDANVLYPAPMRDILLQLAVTDLFCAKWTADIHREWIEALLRNDPRRDRAVLERTRDLMDRNVRDSLVTGYESLIETLRLPDPGDRHVLAAAVVGKCEIIVTQNLRHFPEESLSPHKIEAQHPDEFLRNQLDLAPGVFCSAVRKVRLRLQAPPYSAPDYLAILTRQGLVGTVAELQQFSELI